MKLKEKSIYKGHIGFQKRIDYAEYEIKKWQCQLCKEWITMVLVEGIALLGGGCYSSDIDKEYCDKCQEIRWNIDGGFFKQ